MPKEELHVIVCSDKFLFLLNSLILQVKHRVSSGEWVPRCSCETAGKESWSSRQISGFVVHLYWCPNQGFTTGALKVCYCTQRIIYTNRNFPSLVTELYLLDIWGLQSLPERTPLVLRVIFFPSARMCDDFKNIMQPTTACDSNHLEPFQPWWKHKFSLPVSIRCT